jgi:ABC-type bacteriocin/lantibiotic exporter with double-glycine peptidase domain
LKQGQKNKQKAIEDRMIFMTNLIYNLKNIKILLYEKFFYKKIIEKRNSELNKYEILYQTANKIRSLLWASPTLLILLTIICHIIFCLYNNIKIKIENLIIIFGLIDSLQQPILTFCQTYSSYLISNVSANRIEKYLSETNSDKTIDNKNENKVSDINFQNNEIVFIIGDTGSGKSYLLKQIYNNYKNNINNNIHLIYNGQESFILNDTIQSNIFFMKDKNSIDKFKYLEIIKNSCLENDLSLVEKGDMTQAGEGGCCLSGGQKKRICISRALLEAESNKSKKQILFFDEPTYSLDPETLTTVWKNCFIDFLKDTTRIIATNNLDFLRYSNKIIYVENKEIIFFGDYSEFKNNKDIYDKYLKLDTLFKKRKQEIKDNLNFSIRDNINNFAQSKSNNNISEKKIINQNERNNIQIYRKFIQILIG